MERVRDVTIYDLAERLEVSVATVSRALKNDPVVSKKTKKRVVELAEKMGYRSNHFARNLRKQRTDTIGVMVPRLNSSFMSTVIAGIENVANAEGYNLIITQSSESFEKEIAGAKTMFNNRVDGLLVSLANESENLDHFEMFSKKNIPVVFFDRTEDHERFTDILIDNRKAAYEITTHLIRQGCKRIMHITSSLKRNVYAERLAGYRQALEENNLPAGKDDLIITSLSMEDGENIAQKIAAMHQRPDGIFVSNDNCAAGCVIGLKNAGIRVPQDIAVAGFNNDPVSRVVEPNLTTINYPGYEMGETAARILINHLNGVLPIHTTNSVLLRSELIVRGSSLRK